MSADGEYQDGNAKIQCAVDVEVYVEQDQVVIEANADRISARNQTIRCKLEPDEAESLLEDFRRSTELANRRQVR